MCSSFESACVSIFWGSSSITSTCVPSQCFLYETEFLNVYTFCLFSGAFKDVSAYVTFYLRHDVFCVRPAILYAANRDERTSVEGETTAMLSRSVLVFYLIVLLFQQTFS